MEIIQPYVNNINIIDVNNYSTIDLFKKIELLPNNELLICKHSQLNSEKRYYLNLAFTIPNKPDIISVFYKGDYLYFHEDEFSKIAFTQFLERASYHIYNICHICSHNVSDEIVCNLCGNKLCKNCYHNIFKCPYCRSVVKK